ncbi:MAG TPA: hypothetical protein VIC57_01700 [Candidatus Dormibacteraeota bacterium]|jgi:hypothetical protein
MSRRDVAAAVLGLLLLPACGAGARTAGAARAAPPTPAATATATPAPAISFPGTIVRAPGALVRFGPGMDMPVMDVEAAGRVDTFDGWLTRPDDPPQADAATGRVETWSRDWLRLAGGRGWVSSASVRGRPPAGAAPVAWTPPASLPAATAGVLDIAIDLQDRRATCEVAALKMALA